MLPFSAGRNVRMDSTTAYSQTGWCLTLILALLFLPPALGSHEGIQSGSKHHAQRRPETQFKLATPKLHFDGLQTLSPPNVNLSPPFGSDEPLLQPILGVSRPLLVFPDTDTPQPEELSLPPSAKISMEDQSSDRMLVMGYYPDWLGSTFPPNRVDFERFDWIDFAFAVPDADFALGWDDTAAPRLLKDLVFGAHKVGTKVKLSVGGWTGSKHFSSAVGSNTSRMTFVNNIVATYHLFAIDGIEIDWEYPGRQGASGNKYLSADSANFLLFLQLLRSTLPSAARISVAAEAVPFSDDKGNAMVDLSGYAEVLDWALIMNYDVWGSSSKPGPNAPLHDACNNSTQPDANAVAAYNAWTAANFPASKLVLGLPSYGYISSSTATHLRTRFKSKKKKKKSAKSSAFVRVVSSDGGSDHQVQFRELVEQGAIVRSTNASGGMPTFIGSGGFERMWDSCSDTPYLHSVTSRQIVTYDDPESLGMKAAFAKGVGMLGVNLFDIHGDSEQWDLIDSVRRSIL